MQPKGCTEVRGASAPPEQRQEISRTSADCGKRECRLDGLMLSRAVRTSGAAGLGTGAERLVDDGLDGARAAAALGAATEAAVDLLGVAGKVLRALDGNADIVVRKHVTGTDDHKSDGPKGDARIVFEILKTRAGCKRKIGFLK